MKYQTLEELEYKDLPDHIHKNRLKAIQDTAELRKLLVQDLIDEVKRNNRKYKIDINTTKHVITMKDLPDVGEGKFRRKVIQRMAYLKNKVFYETYFFFTEFTDSDPMSLWYKGLSAEEMKVIRDGLRDEDLSFATPIQKPFPEPVDDEGLFGEFDVEKRPHMVDFTYHLEQYKLTRPDLFSNLKPL